MAIAYRPSGGNMGFDSRFKEREMIWASPPRYKIRGSMLVVVAGITSNLRMKGVLITKKEGLPKDSIIKLNYIFTISEKMIKKFLLNISEEKKKLIKKELIEKIK